VSARLIIPAGIALAWAILPSLIPADLMSPAERAIADSNRAIQSNPNRFEAHNAHALALTRRARETAETAYYDKAESALKESFRLAPENFEGQRIRAWVLLGKHDFAAALELARTLNAKMPDDVLTYGLLADAHTELGNYEEAEKATQWMLDLRAGNIPGLTRASHLRELFGDIEGAIELMQAAYPRIPPNEVEDRAWILVQVAHLERSRGKLDAADTLLTEAFKLFPDYHYALAESGRLRAAQERYNEAVETFRKRFRAAPHPENLYEVANALEQAGRHKEAQEIWKDFEQRATAEMNSVDNCNRELVLFYTDHVRKPAEALRVAKIEFARRKDVLTLDAYAWALHANGQHAEARRHIERALAVGIRDPQFFYHAGRIALKSGDRLAARQYFEKCLEPNGRPEYTKLAREDLRKLPPGK
jgi:tetratricopeptide (TPR) repeat protein